MFKCIICGEVGGEIGLLPENKRIKLIMTKKTLVTENKIPFTTKSNNNTYHCYGILKDPELAEDAFLNAMAKVWQKIDQYDKSRGNFSTWCYNIARNESLLLLKTRKKYVHLSLEDL